MPVITIDMLKSKIQDKYIEELVGETWGVRDSGKISMHDIGSCYRKLYYKYNTSVKPRELDLKTYKQFMHGRVAHQYICERLVSTGLTFSRPDFTFIDNTWNVVGKIDCILRDPDDGRRFYILEIKPYYSAKVKDTLPDIMHIYQVQAYLRFFTMKDVEVSRTAFILYYLSWNFLDSDSYIIKEVPADPNMQAEIEEICRHINYKIPPEETDLPCPRVPKECMYCVYNHVCDHKSGEVIDNGIEETASPS